MFKPQILCRFDSGDRHGLRQANTTRAAGRPVRAVALERRAEGETVSLTGHVRAKHQANVAFRLNGRMIERPINAGDVLTAR